MKFFYLLLVVLQVMFRTKSELDDFSGFLDPINTFGRKHINKVGSYRHSTSRAIGRKKVGFVDRFGPNSMLKSSIVRANVKGIGRAAPSNIEMYDYSDMVYNEAAFYPEGFSVEFESRAAFPRQPPDFSLLFFPPLFNYETDAIPTTEAKYPWIARIIHSRSAPFPLQGTASCIEKRVFIAAARTVATLKVIHTTLIYQNYRLPVRAFVLPSVPTKQMFEDVALLVVEDYVFDGTWVTVPFCNVKRNDDTYSWFENIVQKQEYKAIGYAFEKHTLRNPGDNSEYRLVELPVVVDINICQRVYGRNHIMGYYLPCYLSCTMAEFEKQNQKCQAYLGTEGAAVINTKTNELLGVATWGVKEGGAGKSELPVGFAVPNSESFYKDLACALRIRNVETVPAKGYYQSLCD